MLRFDQPEGSHPAQARSGHIGGARVHVGVDEIANLVRHPRPGHCRHGSPGPLHPPGPYTSHPGERIVEDRRSQRPGDTHDLCRFGSAPHIRKEQVVLVVILAGILEVVHAPRVEDVLCFHNPVTVQPRPDLVVELSDVFVVAFAANHRRFLGEIRPYPVYAESCQLADDVYLAVIESHFADLIRRRLIEGCLRVFDGSPCGNPVCRVHVPGCAGFGLVVDSPAHTRTKAFGSRKGIPRLVQHQGAASQPQPLDGDLRQIPRRITHIGDPAEAPGKPRT